MDSTNPVWAAEEQCRLDREHCWGRRSACGDKHTRAWLFCLSQVSLSPGKHSDGLFSIDPWVPLCSPEIPTGENQGRVRHKGGLLPSCQGHPDTRESPPRCLLMGVAHHPVCHGQQQGSLRSAQVCLKAQGVAKGLQEPNRFTLDTLQPTLNNLNSKLALVRIQSCDRAWTSYTWWW